MCLAFPRYMSKEEFMGKDEPTRSVASSKAERSFNAIDRNHDGYITKEEMLERSKRLTQTQVSTQ